jgi:hypothetical protein
MKWKRGERDKVTTFTANKTGSYAGRKTAEADWRVAAGRTKHVVSAAGVEHD